MGQSVTCGPKEEVVTGGWRKVFNKRDETRPIHVVEREQRRNTKF